MPHNSSLQLPTVEFHSCSTGSLIRAWKKEIAVLTAGNVKLSPDERLSLVHGYDLEIRDVRPDDAGDYVCQIASLVPMEITHTVEILGEAF